MDHSLPLVHRAANLARQHSLARSAFPKFLLCAVYREWRIACIGPAEERRVEFLLIDCDPPHQAERDGGRAVTGATYTCVQMRFWFEEIASMEYTWAGPGVIATIQEHCWRSQRRP